MVEGKYRCLYLTVCEKNSLKSHELKKHITLLISLKVGKWFNFPTHNVQRFRTKITLETITNY